MIIVLNVNPQNVCMCACKSIWPGLHWADVNWVSTKPNKILFKSDSDSFRFSTIFCVNTARKDSELIILCTGAPWFLATSHCFLSFHSLWKHLLAIFLFQWCSSLQSFQACRRYFWEQFRIEGCLLSLRTLVHSHPAARKTLRQGFLYRAWHLHTGICIHACCECYLSRPWWKSVPLKDFHQAMEMLSFELDMTTATGWTTYNSWLALCSFKGFFWPKNIAQ